MKRPLPRLKLSFPYRDLLGAVVPGGGKTKGISGFEEAFARYIGVRHAIFVSSGRAALYLILKHGDLQPGDEILVPAFTFFAVPQVIRALKLKPVFVDVREQDCSLCLDDAESRITPRTRAVIFTHLFGIGTDPEKMTGFARRHNLLLIEDCAQICGGRPAGRRFGGFGEAGYFSFSLTKNITCLGGGMITTDRDPLAERIRADLAEQPPVSPASLAGNLLKLAAMKTSAWPALYGPLVFPLISRLGRRGRDPINDLFREPENPDLAPGDLESSIRRPRNFQARIGVGQLERLPEVNAARLAHGRHLLESLRRCGVRLRWQPEDQPGNIFMSFVVLSDDRDALRMGLWRRGIDTSIGFMSFCPAVFAPETARRYPVAAGVSRGICHIPVYPLLSGADLRKLTDALCSCLGRA